MKYSKLSAALLVSVLMLPAGCATHKESVSTTETRNDPNTYPSQTTVQTTEKTSTDTSTEDSGVLSSTVNVVGEVVALPFRAVGALFRAIF